MRTRFAEFAQLARVGGTPVRTEPFPSWPVFDDEMLDAARGVLKSGKCNYWTGQECRQFEKEFAEKVECEHASAVANGTAALEVAMHAIDIQPGDEVVVPPRTFVATASAVWMRGAVPVFADIDPVSGNITAEAIEAVLTPKTKAIIVVHTSGWMCDMDPIMELARERGLKVIEDCAQAHGATYCGRSVGSIGDISAFSFCQEKIMTTAGEGGMVTTNNAELHERAWSFKDHGKSWDAVYNRQHSTIFKLVHDSLGTNLRMTELQGAIGRLALQRLDGWVATRRRNAAILNERLAAVDGIEVPLPDVRFGHSYYKHYAYLTADRLISEDSRDEIVRSLHAEGIPCGSGLCCEIYLEKGLANAGLAPPDRLQNARELGARTLMFMVHPTLTVNDMNDTAASVEKVLRAAPATQHPTARAA